MKEPTMISKMRSGRCGKVTAGMGVLLFALILMAIQAQAMIIDTGNPNLDARFDNTLTYSTMLRLEDQDPDLIANPNADDGDRNFDTGIVMNRFDLLSEFDLSYNKFGIRLSGAAWYDFVYNTENDNDSPGTISYTSVANDEFTDETKRRHGRDAELLEAFTFGSFDVGDMSVRYRAGQFSQWWGDSFFFGWNGVAGALAPVDVSKAATLPNTQGRELVRPIPQLSVQLQVLDDLSFSGYYQFEWEPSKFFGVGSYFSPVDFLSAGAEQFLLPPPPEGPGTLVSITGDEPSDSGQFGLMAKYNTMFATYGFYYANFHAKDFLGPVVNPVDHTYYRFYPEDIELMAASMNFAIDQYTFAAEVTYMTNVPLQGSTDQSLGLMTVFPDAVPGMPHDPLYATGDTLSINVNTFSGGMAGNFFCDSQDLIAEIGYVTELSADNEAWVDRSYKKDALKAMVVYTPKWYQVAPGLDLTLPMGVGYTFKGAPTSALWGGGAEDQGDFNIGVGATYNVVWGCELMYRHYMGDTDVQGFADRDYVSFYIRRAF